MTTETVTIDGTEVQVTETEDGFEAEEVKDDFVQYLEEEHCGGVGGFDGAEVSTLVSNTRWVDGRAAVYKPEGRDYVGAIGMKNLDKDDNVVIAGTGLNEAEDRFEVHLHDAREE